MPCIRSKGRFRLCSEIVRDSVAAISVGLLDDVELLDLEYVEDKDAEVDLNLVMTGSGQFIEVQGTGEEATFSRSRAAIAYSRWAKSASTRSRWRKKRALGSHWPL